MKPHPPADLYVGYRPLPAQMRRSLRVLVPGMLFTLTILAIGIAAAQRSPGSGLWRQSPVTLSGTAIAQPVPALLHTNAGQSQLILLVEEGKHGAHTRLDSLHGSSITLTGTTLSRGGMTMLEIASISTADDASVASMPQPIWQPTLQTLTGEIVDAKCYLGAMKPGDGKAHKACATLCVRNGIPAMLVTAEGAFLIAAGWQAQHATFIAEPVEVSATLGEWGTVPVIHVHTITRRGLLARSSPPSALAQ